LISQIIVDKQVHYAEKQMKVLVNSNCELTLVKKNEKSQGS
jgi:hypothetical protein